MSTTLVNGPNQAYASERITSITASKALTAATYDATRGGQADDPVYTYPTGWSPTMHPEEAFITCETADVRYTLDGTTPTTTATTAIGHILASGDSLVIQGYQNIVRFRAINAVGSSGSALYVTYSR